jgi:hypothetical protein
MRSLQCAAQLIEKKPIYSSSVGMASSKKIYTIEVELLSLSSPWYTLDNNRRGKMVVEV